MTENNRMMRAGVFALTVLAALSIMLVGSMAVSADTPVPEEFTDMGDFNSMSCRFVYTGEGADTVEWDFGDGSEIANGKIVDHTFPAKGTYYVKQTSTNEIGSTVAYYKMTINGYPTVTFNLNGHGDSIVKVQSAFAIPAEKPADPSADGLTFGGWYTDAGCTRSYTGENIEAPTTLYAKWIGGGTPADPGPAPSEHDLKIDDGTIVIGIGVIGILALIGGAATRHPVVAIVGAAVAVVAVAFHQGVIGWPF